MQTIVYPRYTLVEKIIMGFLFLIARPLQWVVEKTEQKMRELDFEEPEK